jgi:hypothetical protein
MAGEDNVKKEEEAPEEPPGDGKIKKEGEAPKEAQEETTKDADEGKEDEKEEGKEAESKDNTDTVQKVIKKRGPRNRLDAMPEKSGKRQRKSAEAYKPPDFTEIRPYKEAPKGRGTKLRDIPALKAIIEAVSVQDPKKEIFNAFRFIFPVRGKVTPKDKKERLLDFAGFLPPIDEEEDKEAREKRDEDAEVSVDYFCLAGCPHVSRLTLFSTTLGENGAKSIQAHCSRDQGIVRLFLRGQNARRERKER